MGAAEDPDLPSRSSRPARDDAPLEATPAPALMAWPAGGTEPAGSSRRARGGGEIVTCRRGPLAGTRLALVLAPEEGEHQVVGLGTTDDVGRLEADVLGLLQQAFPGWPRSLTALRETASVVLESEPAAVVGELRLADYEGLRYREHLDFLATTSEGADGGTAKP